MDNQMPYSRRHFISTASLSLLATVSNGKKPIETASNIESLKFLADARCDDRRVDIGTTSVRIGDKVYGAQSDGQGPIGGGDGYVDVFTGGDYVVDDFQSLVDALSNAKEGQVVFIQPGSIIDLTTHIYIDRFVLEIPQGVVLASCRGLPGQEGALIVSDTLDTPVLVRTKGPDVRITGLRIQGPNPKRHMEHHQRSFGKNGLGRDYYYQFPVSRGIVTEYDRITVDNCEISAFSHAAIRLVRGEGHRIHHNFIHHCQYNGLGYGISHLKASSSIEYNLFDSNRHSIAGTGQQGCSYLARNNVEYGISLSHCFDMHGGTDRKDNTDVAGTSIVINNNTFRAPHYAVRIRGEPEEQCEVYRNWFVKHRNPNDAVVGFGRTHVYDNLYGDENPSVQ